MSRFIVGATWEDSIPHLSEQDKLDLRASYPAYQQDARTKGIPQLGSGAIYPFAESSIRVEPFEIPRHWRKGFGLDCALSGTTAIAWGALDPESQTLYIYSVYKRPQAETAVHVEAIKARGLWIHGVGDAADVIDSDRTQFISLYRRHGVNLELPDKSVETGIQSVYDRISAGKLKVWSSCTAWFDEFRLYRRDDHGRVVKQNDHLMDSTRYLVKSGLQRMRTQPVPQDDEPSLVYIGEHRETSWMG